MKIVHTNEPGFENYWTCGSEKIVGAAPVYSSFYRNYTKKWFGDRIVFDDSFVVVGDANDVLALVPLYSFRNSHNSLNYCFGNAYLHGPLISKPPQTKHFNKICKLIYSYIEELSLKKGIHSHSTMIEPFELLEGRHYYNYLIDYGYKDESSVTNLIECYKPEEILWANLRKSHKWCVNQAKREFSCRVIYKSNYDFELCEAYRKLHAFAAGRVTRCIESFYAMYDAIKDGKAFLVLIEDSSHKVVGSYYFILQGDYALYASAATDPGLKSNNGVGNFGVWQGIISSKELGCKFVDLAQMHVRPDITEKERNIDLFKRGFGGKRVTVFRGTKMFTNNA